MVCKIDTDEKGSHFFKKMRTFFGWGGWIRTNEMADPKSAALPLGYAPINGGGNRI